MPAQLPPMSSQLHELLVFTPHMLRHHHLIFCIFFPGSIRKSRETLTKDIHGPWQSLPKKTCTSLTTSCISKYILKFICCQVWTESMAKGEETKFTQSTRVGSINRSHQKMNIIAHKAPTSIYDIFFSHRGRSRLNPLPRFLITLMGEPNVSSLLVGWQSSSCPFFIIFCPFETS